MPKCRTCAALGGYCEVTGRVFLGTIPGFIHIASRFTPPPGTIPEECSYWSKREMPLLVDELGEALKNVWGGRFTDGGGDCGCERPGYTVLLTSEQCEIIRAVLARYKEEVIDA